MFRKLLATLLVLGLFAGFALADLIEGKVKDIDADKGTITLTVGEKDQTFKLAKDAKASTKSKFIPLSQITPGLDVVLTRNNDDNVITQIQIKTKAKK